MPYVDEFGPGGEDESPTRRDIREIENRRLTVGESYLDLDFTGLVLFRVGRGYIFLIEVAVLAGMLALVPLAQAGLPAGLVAVGEIVGVIVLLVLGIYTKLSLADWVEEHNAEIDDEIREVVRQARDKEI